MDKELFISSINAIKQQMDKDKECLKAFKIILPFDYISGYDNHVIIDTMIKLLQELTNDENEWINYFIWELEFGDKYKDGCVKIDNENIPLRTSEDLWNLIVNK